LLSQHVVAMTAWDYGSLLSQGRRDVEAVIASAAKQSIVTTRKKLDCLRFARNDDWGNSENVYDRHSGAMQSIEPQMCNCTSGNLEIPRCANGRI